VTGARINLADEAALRAWAGRLAAALPPSALVALHGPLGAGKSTLVRGVLQALGYTGAVPSPTYTLIETYELPECRLHHLDLDRLGDPEELEFIGIRDLFADPALCFVEWPERGAGVLPGADLALTLELAGAGRQLTLSPSGAAGEAVASTVI